MSNSNFQIGRFSIMDALRFEINDVVKNLQKKSEKVSNQISSNTSQKSSETHDQFLLQPILSSKNEKSKKSSRRTSILNQRYYDEQNKRESIFDNLVKLQSMIQHN